MEIWKPIHNFPSYDCSTKGRLRNVKTQRILDMYISETGYVRACLMKNGEQHSVKVARLIAETFLGAHPGMDVRYKDNDRTNICVDNLEWCTRSELVGDAYKRGTKKAWKSIPIKIVETGEAYETIKDCAKHISCDPSYIRQYLAGERPDVKGYHFERIAITL